MTKVVNFKFDDNPDGVYFCGQLVSGEVELTLAKPIAVWRIAIQIRGVGKSGWDKKWKGKQNHSILYEFYGKEEYFSSTLYVVGSNDNASKIELPAGNYTYKFAHPLSNLLPCSFEGTHGSIRYYVKVIIVRPWKSDKIYSNAFTVLRPLDLNMFSTQFRLPGGFENSQSFEIGTLKPNQLNIKVSLNQIAFVPGELIPIQAEINNESSSDVVSIRFVLRNLITYRANKSEPSYKEEIIDLVTESSGHVGRKSCKTFEKNLVVPPVIPSSNVNQSKIIEINYDVKVEVVTTIFHKNVFVVCPITIGTVPLVHDNNGNGRDHLQQSDWSIAKAGTSASSLPTLQRNVNTEPSATYSVPPPSYEDVMQDDDADYDINELKFVSQAAKYVPRKI